MKGKFIILIPAAVLAAAFSLVAGGQAPGAAPDAGAPDVTAAAEIDSVAYADSVALALAARRVDTAAEAYKHLKFVQYDGTTESALFPMVIDVHAKVLDAMATPRVDESDLTRLKGILLDLDPLLIRGAVFYSSAGDRDGMNRFATACVDTRMRDDMSAMPFGNANAALYPSMVYCAASNAYNSGDYERALDYFEEYLDGDGDDHREQVAMFYGQACINTGQQARGIERLSAAVNRYPTNYNLLMITLQDCLDAGRHDRMRPLMERALLMRPDDEQLLNVQAALFEGEGNYSGALDIYSRLYEMHPESIAINRHLALCYYNLGADAYNQALTESDDKASKRKMRQSKAYLLSAASKLEAVVDNDPSNPKYLRALAMTYGCLGETVRLSGLNSRLTALGMQPVTVAGMPEAIAYDDRAAAAGGESAASVPDFSEFAREYADRELAKFAQRGEFEKSEDYEKRVSQEKLYAEYERLWRAAEAEYLRQYAGRIRISDLSLEPYDVDNESYLINSAMGPIVLRVPLGNKEAEAFKASWANVQLRNPKFCIRDNRVGIASVDFVTPGGKTYSYAAEAAADYEGSKAPDLSSLLASQSLPSGGAQSQTSYARGGEPASARVLRAKSDVDRDIPITTRKASNTVALVWANENYKNVTHVQSALNDGETFAEYCQKTLGVPEGQIIVMRDATYAEMRSSVNKLRQLTGVLGDGVDVIFYYAGHGFPDESTKDAYLLPVDGDGVDTELSYPLKKLYADLSNMRAENVMVFLDACFSGATRDGGMLAEARGVALKPRPADPEGSMFVLTAASDQETAMPYREKNHGLFTYFLLKKLQETKGNVTLKALSDYVQENVRKNSLTVNRKSQTPSVKVSGSLATEWKNKKMRP